MRLTASQLREIIADLVANDGKKVKSVNYELPTSNESGTWYAREVNVDLELVDLVEVKDDDGMCHDPDCKGECVDY